MKLPDFFKRKKAGIALLSVIVLLVAIRISLPFVLLHFANKNLKTLKGYTGNIEDIDLALYRGAYKICAINIDKVDSATGKQTPFMSARQIDLSVEWKGLLRGNIVGELIFDSPEVRFTLEKVEPAQVQKDTADFRELLKDFMPLKINRMEMLNGKLRFIDSTSKPMVDIEMTAISMSATNLRNVYDSVSLLPAVVVMTADVYEGFFKLNMKLNPLASKPTFDLNVSLDSTNLVLLNDFFQAYAKIDVSRGTFGLYTEVASEQGQFTGYIKPLISDLKVVGAEDRDDNIFRKMWEAIVGTTAELLENQKKDQIATRIPLDGNLDDPNVRIWYAMIEVLRNGFIRALHPSIDNAINIQSVDKSEKDNRFSRKLFKKKDRESK